MDKNKNHENIDKQVEVKVIYKLNDAHLQKLEREVGIPFVDKETTELKAGFMLGIQYILKKIRDGIDG